MNGHASYTFFPWLRRGISTEITRVDGAGDPSARAQIPVTLELSAGGQPVATTVRLDLHGPGEVAGFDPRMIVRLDPRPGVQDAEPNYFPAVELHEPDFPWRYTPARATAQNRLRPWVVLIVLSPTEIKSQSPATSEGALPRLEVRSSALLPDLGQSWAWAHAQVSALEAGESVQEVIDREPQRALARLVCPIQLRPNTPYTAFLVPAFERGRLAGLKLPIPDGPGSVVDALTPAWTAGQNDVLLPVYFRWQFSTGAQGDFEFLVRKLRPVQIRNVGKRAMDVSEPDVSLPPAADEPLEMEGALKALFTEAAPWPPAQKQRFLEGTAELSGLTDALNLPQELLEGGDATPVIAPPLYGRWHAKQPRLRAGQPPPWFNELNEDPRHRASASLGTSIVQQQQEQLMASAWEQLADVLATNEKLRQAQMAREMADRVHTKHLATLDEEELFIVTAPTHRRVRASPQTVHALGRQARLSYFALGTFRRVSRARGPVVRRIRIARGRISAMLARVNRREITPAPAPVTPTDLRTRAKVGADLVPPGTTTGTVRGLVLLSWLLWLLAVLLVLLAVFVVATPIAIGIAVVAAVGLAILAIRVRRGAQRTASGVGFRDGTLSGDQVRDTPAAPAFVPVESLGRANLPVEPAAGSTDVAGVAAFRTAMADLADQAFVAVPVEIAPVPLETATIRQRLLSGLNPRVNHVLALRQRLKVADWTGWRPRDPLDQVMASPDFPQPMYEQLRDLSQEWLMPGVGTIPQNSTGLLQTNQRFIEAYMAGLNHEMARELMWREYPTDQRGTCFRQFWDVRGFIDTAATPRDRESLLDIKRLHEWNGAALGQNTARTPPPGGAYLVLIVRGEVLKRYPTTLVYAVEAVLAPEGNLTLGTNEAHPVFGGTLEPDIAFFGFELTTAQVRGTEDSDTDLGWFFVLQQQPTEPRFGLDIPEAGSAGAPVGPTWDDLSWGNLADTPSDLEALRFIDLAAVRPDTSFTDTSGAVWHESEGTDAAQLGYITLQKPFRVAMHGKSMVPEGP